MKVQKINESPITQEDINLYKNAISKLEGFVFNASDVDMDKRIITIRLGNVEDELTLVNPKVVKYSENPLVYLDIYIPIVGMYCVGIVATVGSTK